MKCPYCNEEMKEGVIQSQHELNWLPKEAKHKLFGVSFLHKGAILLSKFSFMEGSRVTAFCCESCKKIIIDFAEID